MIVALAGGVGGAKLADGLYRELPPDELAVIVNTADDFLLYGLHISPDLDTVMYTLGGLANPATGWGILGDTFNSLEMIARYGAPDWFRLGDRDLATHMLRTSALRDGATLTQTTATLGAALGIRAHLLPMCDEPVRTIVSTPAGDLPFQEYFVHRQAKDWVSGVRFEGIELATISPAIGAATLKSSAVVICPSNPFVSIAPILQVAGMRDTLVRSDVPIIAVSPIIAGQAVKGPAARMLESLGKHVSVLGIAEAYADLGVTLLIDEADAHLANQVAAHGVKPVVASIMMATPADRRALARTVLELAIAERSSRHGESGPLNGLQRGPL